MDQRQGRTLRTIAIVPLPVVTGLAYYLAAMISLYLTRGESGLATLWPGSGILFAALFAAPRDKAWQYLVAGGIASLVANLGSGNTLLGSIGFTFANLGEAGLAVWLLRTRAKCRISFTDTAGLSCFCKAAAVGPAFSATVASLVVENVSLTFWVSWFSTALLGILVVTPLILIGARAMQSSHRVRPRMRGETPLVLGMVAVVTGLVFAQSSYPLLFVPMLAVSIAVLRLGPVGAAGGVLIVAVISSIGLQMGFGPHTLVQGGPIARSLFLQFYLLALFASALPIAVLLAARGQLLDQVAETVRLLQLAEQAAHVGHWRLNTATMETTWSPEVFRIYGVTGPDPLPFDDTMSFYHVDDYPMVLAHLEEAILHQRGYEHVVRLIRPDGEMRYVLSRGEIDRVADDGAADLFGIVQDVTERVLQEAAMEEARAQAEEAARHATMLAETDQLTGIANRRRTNYALDQAVLRSGQTGGPVSIAIFDIDHFKRINDTYGHQAGDEVLRRVAQSAAAELRSGDTIGRFGGEEFVIVLPDATGQTALLVAERVRIAIEDGGSNPCVTISVGIAELVAGETAESLLRRADQALYSAKNEGRNTLRLAA